MHEIRINKDEEKEIVKAQFKSPKGLYVALGWAILNTIILIKCLIKRNFFKTIISGIKETIKEINEK